MKAVIHIGAAKTGTSTIQDFLGKNRLALKKQGIVIPTSSASWCTGYQADLVVAACSRDKWMGGTSRITTLLKPLSTSADQDQLWKNYRHKIETNCHENDIVVFSCETLYFFDEHEVTRLKELMDTMFDDVSVVVYLRRQPEYLISHYNTSVRMGASGNYWSDFPPRLHCPNYGEVVKRWSIFGKVKVRIYDKREFYNNDLLSDFSHTVGFEMAGLEPLENQNESMGSAEVEFLRLLNSHVPRFLAPGTLNPGYDSLETCFQGLAPGEKRTAYHLTRSEAQHILDECRVGNDWIAREYLGREKLFSEDVSMCPETVDSPHGLTLEKCVELSALLWKERCEKIRQLQEEIQTIKSKPKGLAKIWREVK